MSTEMDDEELMFEEGGETPPASAQSEQPAAGAAEAAAAEPAAEESAPLPRPETVPAENAAAGVAGQPAEQAATKKRSLTGMLVAAGFGICILTSTVSAVQSWRAAGLAAEAAGGDGKKLAARLSNMEKLLLQQRDALDDLTTRPAALAAAAAPDGNQINALAAAVRANQETADRLPSVIMAQVDARLQHTGKPPAPATSRPAAARPGTPKQTPAKSAGGPKPWRSATAARPVAKAAPTATPASAATAKSGAIDQLQSSQQAMQKKLDELEARTARPAGEAIRYP